MRRDGRRGLVLGGGALLVGVLTFGIALGSALAGGPSVGDLLGIDTPTGVGDPTSGASSTAVPEWNVPPQEIGLACHRQLGCSINCPSACFAKAFPSDVEIPASAIWTFLFLGSHGRAAMANTKEATSTAMTAVCRILQCLTR